MSKRSLRISVVIICSLCAIITIMILAESFRAVISAEEFSSRMIGMGYTVEEVTDIFEHVEAHIIADCGTFYIEFITHESITDARLTFNSLRNDLEYLCDIIPHTWSSSWVNSWYEQWTSDGAYSRIIRIRNTILFVNTTDENAVDVAKIFETLGQ